MMWRSAIAAIFASCLIALAHGPAADDIKYVPLDAPPGMSQAVVVQNAPLVHTGQILPLDREGKPVGEGAIDRQIEQVLNNLEAVLKVSGSGLDKLVRVNVYALAPQTVDRVRELLSKRLAAAVRPTIAGVLTPMPRRHALVAVDAIAVGSEAGQAVALKRCDAVAGEEDCADAAILPWGGVAYLSGVPEESDVAVPAVTKSMATLCRTLGLLKLTPAHVVQLKVFLRPATSADKALDELKKFFPGQLTPPVVFVEWNAAPQAEIELIAQWPPTDMAATSLEFFNPPDTRPLPIFSRVALVRSERRIYTSGLFARKVANATTAAGGETQSGDVFAQLKEILNATGSDMSHLAKALYYVCDPYAARGFDITRPQLLDPQRPPAASLIMVHGVGKSGRTLTMDMIAVGREK